MAKKKIDITKLPVIETWACKVNKCKLCKRDFMASPNPEVNVCDFCKHFIVYNYADIRL